MKICRYQFLFALLIFVMHSKAFAASDVGRLKPCSENQEDFYHNCEGSRLYGTEGLYFGEFQNNKRHGRGWICKTELRGVDDAEPRPNCEYFFGYWAEDKRNGWGEPPLSWIDPKQPKHSGLWVEGKFIAEDMSSPALQAQRDSIIRWEQVVLDEKFAKYKLMENFERLAYLITFFGAVLGYIYFEFYYVPKKHVLKFGDFRLGERDLMFINKDKSKSYALDAIENVSIVKQRNWYLVGLVVFCIINFATNSDAHNDENVFPELMALLFSNNEFAKERFFITPTILFGGIFLVLALRHRYSEIIVSLSPTESLMTFTKGFGYVNPGKFVRALAYRKSLLK